MRPHLIAKCLLYFVSIGVVLFFLDTTVHGQNPSKTHSVIKGDRAHWFRLLKWPKDCEAAFQRTNGAQSPNDYGGLEFYRLAREAYMVRVLCYRGAYQPGSILLYFDRGNASATRLLKLQGFKSKDDHGEDLPYSKIDGLVTFDKTRKILEVFSKYRGLGDCGLFVRYRFYKGQPFVTEARERECDDSPIHRSTDPHRWPKKPL
jgi:hypothetical protein